LLPEELATGCWTTPEIGYLRLEAIVFTTPLEIGDMKSEATAFMIRQATGGMK
jgi:hypothetical protein